MKDRSAVMLIGCARGIGKAVAERFLRERRPLILVDRSSEAGALAGRWSAEGAQVRFVRADVRSLAAYQRAIASQLRGQSVSTLVYMARARERQAFGSVTSAVWDEVFEVGLRGAFFAAQTAFPLLEGPSPSFIALSSVAARFAGQESAAYHCSKAGLEQLVRYLAVAGRARRVRANGVRAGFIVQDEHRGRYDAKKNAAYRRLAEGVHPSASVGSSRDVAESVAFLASEAARFINGAVLTLDGGLTVQDAYAVAERLRPITEGV